MDNDTKGPSPCAFCGRTFDCAANHEAFETVPYAGTLFYSHGHYGSTAFDPMDGTKLEIAICDECLFTAANTGRAHGAPPMRP